MTVGKLIEDLEKLPKDAPVVLCDSNRMAHEATGEPSGEGLYYDFEVSHDDETFFSYEDEEQEHPISTVVFHFETDYEEKEKLITELDADIKRLEIN